MIRIAPHKGFQEKFTRTGVDVCVAGGSVAVGKSAGAVLAMAEYFLIPDFRGVFLRNNVDDLKAGGGLLDTFEEFYGDNVRVIRSDNPRVVWKSTGATIEVTHVADQSHEKVEQRFKGRQLDVVYFDEGTGFTFDTFTTIASRNRGRTEKPPQILITTNPKRKHWLRRMVDWYIGSDGFVDPEREGVVRYFFINGKTVDDIVWGGSKEEVYYQCRRLIDAFVKEAYKGTEAPVDAWKSLIKSFVYYQGHMAENTENMERNAGYLGSVAMAGGATALNYFGNWDADEDDDKDAVIGQKDSESVFLNDDQRNGDRWVTCDLADTGTDNFIAIAWDGLHVIGIKIMNRSMPRENADTLRMFAREYDVADGHIIYDAVRGRYINDYIPSAIPFESYRAPLGVNALQYQKLKDVCYGKLVYLIKNNGISFDQSVASSTYTHAKMRHTVSVRDEFCDEARVVRFVDAQNGKKRLMTKKEMNRNLGHGRSMDLLDPCAMRMYPLLNIADGYELETSRRKFEEESDDISSGRRVNIYDDTNWF